MSLDPKKYTSDLWQGIDDPKARRALMDLAQKVEKLARDANTSIDTFPSGAIVFWVGAANTIPRGWVEYTALRGRFPRGMASGGTPGATGGSSTHTHGGVTGVSTNRVNINNGTGVTVNLPNAAHDHSISSADHTNPYLDGVWIQKL